MEQRIATWVSIGVGLLVATPIARSLYREYCEYRDRDKPMCDVVPLPSGWTRDIYDSTR